MILPKHPLVLLLFLIAAASNFNPVSAGTAFATLVELETAVNLYCDGTFNAATSPYGPIEGWDVSKITDMNYLFYEQGSCNPAIGSWDVLKVENFSGMFAHAHSFNQDISSWHVWGGTNFQGMFWGADAFNQDISSWDVSYGTDFSGMFEKASAFNQDISDWGVGNGKNFYAMFERATAFNQDISGWNVSSGTDFENTFYGATSFDQPSLYCNWQRNNYFKTGSNVCTNGANCGWGVLTTCPFTNNPTSNPTEKPTVTPTTSPTKVPPSSPTAGTAFATCGGDPHCKTFFGHSYSYHGQCDMVLFKSFEFSDLGIDIHIRTTRVDNAKVGYSYISGAAVQLGFDVLEVKDDGELILNGNAVSSPITFDTRFPLRKTFKGNNNKIIVYDLDLTVIKGVPESIQIRVNTKAKMIFVEVYGRFPDGLGLLGPPSDDSRMLARDGVTDLVGEWNSFGEEWQVRSDEPKLFHENRAPQYPQGCVYESSNTRAMTLRRRLMDGSAVTEKDAEGACSGSKGKSKEFCIADVMATGMLDLAEDEFYLNHE